VASNIREALSVGGAATWQAAEAAVFAVRAVAAPVKQHVLSTRASDAAAAAAAGAGGGAAAAAAAAAVAGAYTRSLFSST
jgi:hypothetical protein